LVEVERFIEILGKLCAGLQFKVFLVISTYHTNFAMSFKNILCLLNFYTFNTAYIEDWGRLS